LKEGNEFQGNRVRVKVVKNKVAPPFKTAKFDIMFNEGISKEGGLIDVGSDIGLVEKSGSWYSYKNEKIGQGRINSIAYLKENTKVRDTLEKELRDMLSKNLGISVVSKGANEAKPASMEEDKDISTPEMPED
jgi:recombination protein RecA